MLLKTNDVQKSEWLVLHFPLRSHSCLASGRPLHQLMIHSGAMTLCKFRMLTRWYRGGSSSCSLNNIPLVPKLRLPSLRRQFVGFPRCTCDVVTTFHCFVRSAILLRALSIVCVFLTSLHNLRNSHQVPSGNDASRFDDLGLLD